MWGVGSFLFKWKTRKRSSLNSMQQKQKGEMEMPKDMMSMSKEMSMNGRGGHLYMQTNEVKNAIIHYHRSTNGTLTEVERVATGGAGSGTYKTLSGQESAPNAFEGAASVILSPDRKFLLATHGGGDDAFSFRWGAA